MGYCSERVELTMSKLSRAMDDLDRWGQESDYLAIGRNKWSRAIQTF
jgi:hypothetical protein